jgi:hypothetical protein
MTWERRRPLVSGTAYALGVGLALASTLAALLTLAVPGLLSGPAAMIGSARGTALVVLLGGVPSLVAGVALARRGSVRGLTIAAGGTAYLLYNAFMLLFATPFNRAFPAYEVMFGIALWLLVLLGRQLWRIGIRLERVSLRPVAVFMLAVVALNAVAWLARIVPATFASRPGSLLDGTGLTTNPVYVQDLAVCLPAFAWLAFGVWKAHGPRVLLAPGALWCWVLEAVSVAVDQWWGHHLDPGSSVTSLAVVPVFVVLALVVVGPLVRVLHVLPEQAAEATRAAHPRSPAHA